MIMKLIFNFVFLFDILLEQQIKNESTLMCISQTVEFKQLQFLPKAQILIYNWVFNLRVLKSCHSVTVSQHRLVEAGPNDIIKCWPSEMRYVMCGGGQ